MTRRVFFSFEYSEDVFRANVVRNSWVTKDWAKDGFVDAAEFEKIQKGGDDAIRKWINYQMAGCSVTVVLVGAKTCSSRWVKYEIEQSAAQGKGLLGIDISNINNLSGLTSSSCGPFPIGYPYYYWFHDRGYDNLGSWIEQAARTAGR